MANIERYEANGFYYWPEVEVEDGRYHAVVKFVCIEENMRRSVSPQSDEEPGDFDTYQDALDAAIASGHHSARTRYLALKWIWGT